MKLAILSMSHGYDCVAINGLMLLLKCGGKEEIELAEIWMKMERYAKIENLNVDSIDRALAVAKTRIAAGDIKTKQK
jgi:hypothetical protein